MRAAPAARTRFVIHTGTPDMPHPSTAKAEPLTEAYADCAAYCPLVSLLASAPGVLIVSFIVFFACFL
ncbi:hypothetical protein C7402_14018 [Paraburkholderia unamae]|uniref:Uncharacterized protein n=1 Tax=Paraburkholderia unamae TaxID=219649 RepID=A0ABX5K759_9BURK|nr:hypothetical protein C7402_14018 [Paraburkholderia unamae]RAR49297.1 hypothetical protein C7401_14618 [Paraburkholderia unamae]